MVANLDEATPSQPAASTKPKAKSSTKRKNKYEAAACCLYLGNTPTYDAEARGFVRILNRTRTISQS